MHFIFFYRKGLHFTHPRLRANPWRRWVSAAAMATAEVLAAVCLADEEDPRLLGRRSMSGQQQIQQKLQLEDLLQQDSVDHLEGYVIKKSRLSNGFNNQASL